MSDRWLDEFPLVERDPFKGRKPNGERSRKNDPFAVDPRLLNPAAPARSDPVPAPSAALHPPAAVAPPVPEEPGGSGRLMAAWEALSRIGLADVSLRLGGSILLVASILLAAWGMRAFYRFADASGAAPTPIRLAAQAALQSVEDGSPVSLPDYEANFTAPGGVGRRASVHTDVPSRPREQVIQYTVLSGDTLFGIAQKFGLKPETILWSNQLTLGDNPHNLRPNQTLNILPLDGAYYRWSAGDGLNGVAKFFSVSPEDIIGYPPNRLSADSVGDYANPNIDPGSWLVIPSGRREFVSWSAPVIPRDKPEVASVLGPGACKANVSGAVGTGTFVWPAQHHYLSGYDFAPNANHPGVDIDGNAGDPVYAADSGVIVYSGWNNWGYGNVVVISHGNGWQTLYAHLSAINVICGQNVVKGGFIGAIGSTGNASGSHLHFEMMYEGTKANPHNYLK
jgi:murein DD-endopeptidase MepM/ murein hydrolase activator NlpD